MRCAGAFFLYSIVDIARREMVLEQARVIRQYKNNYTDNRSATAAIFNCHKRSKKYCVARKSTSTTILVIAILTVCERRSSLSNNSLKRFTRNKKNQPKLTQLIRNRSKNSSPTSTNSSVLTLQYCRKCPLLGKISVKKMMRMSSDREELITVFSHINQILFLLLIFTITSNRLECNRFDSFLLVRPVRLHLPSSSLNVLQRINRRNPLWIQQVGMTQQLGLKSSPSSY